MCKAGRNVEVRPGLCLIQIVHVNACFSESEDQVSLVDKRNMSFRPRAFGASPKVPCVQRYTFLKLLLSQLVLGLVCMTYKSVPKLLITGPPPPPLYHNKIKKRPPPPKRKKEQHHNFSTEHGFLLCP